MIGFNQYVDHLLALAKGGDLPSRAAKKAIAAALDGQPGRVLSLTVETEARRDAGAFFTGSNLAKRLVHEWRDSIATNDIQVFDPACGAGDLLLAVARNLPLGNSFEETVRRWGKQLHGRDIHESFILATKARLLLLASTRGAFKSVIVPDLASVFPGIVANDFFRTSQPKANTHLVMNPPFTLVQAPQDCKWADGTVNHAAIFFETALRNARAGTQVAAILPDVLRTGSRYKKWRRLVEELGTITSMSVAGHFGKLADVDVFFLRMTAGSGLKRSRRNWWPRGEGPKIEDLFSVNVGAVVPFRDRKRGAEAPYFDTGLVKPWATLRESPIRRKFSGTLYPAPFVAVRRTSGPNDKARAVASVISTREPCAVENHLLVLRPLDGKVRTCWKLLRYLKTSPPTEWLNRRIRCRHLTVEAIRQLPYRSESFQ